jgi:hypothetical protein
LKFVNSPNLPKSKVKAVLISADAGQAVLDDLKRFGIEPITVNPCPDIQPQVSAHPDMLFHHVGNNKIVYYNSDSNRDVYERLKELGFELIPISKKLAKEYPEDIALNAARIGNYIFCKMGNTATELLDYYNLDYYNNENIKIIDIKQGYAKCSVCVVSENAIITADKSIAKAAMNVGIDVLLIKEGFIKLNGYNYGFIGGCCGKLSENILAFCGNIKKHPEYNRIQDFLKEHNVSIIILDEKSELHDIGSIIPLIEQK